MERRTDMKLSTRLLVLLALMGAGLIVASIGTIFLPFIGQGILSMLMLQDILAFIVPAVVFMIVFYHRPRVWCLCWSFWPFSSFRYLP